MYIINENILQTPIENGKILLLEPKAGLYYEMNEVSALIFNGISEGLLDEEILEVITGKYDININQAERDMVSQLKIFLEQNIIMLQKS